MQQPHTGDVVFYVESTGVKLEPGQPLVAGTTYYADLGSAASPWTAVQWKWDLAIVITAITIESSCLGTRGQDGHREGDFWGGVEVWELAAQGWHPETAVATVTAAGGGAATSFATSVTHIGGGGQRRLRAKVVVGGTGGKLRGRPHHKS